jgi:prophage DNA circulation protein
MKVHPITFVLLVASLSMPNALHAQSLGELAKKAQEQRDKAKAEGEKAKAEGEKGNVGASTAKPSTPPVKSYTNQDLVGDSIRPAAAPPATKTEPAVKEASSKEAATAKSDEPQKDEAYWRKRMTTLRGNLARDSAACVPVAKKVRELDDIYADSVFYVDGKPMVNRASAAVIETKQVDAKTELRQCVAKVALDQTAIDTAEEEARRLGVLPGWLR